MLYLIQLFYIVHISLYLVQRLYIVHNSLYLIHTYCIVHYSIYLIKLIYINHRHFTWLSSSCWRDLIWQSPIFDRRSRFDSSYVHYPILDTSISGLWLSFRASRSDQPPCILKQGGLESSSQRPISLIGKTKRIAFFSAKKNIFKEKKEKKKKWFFFETGWDYWYFYFFLWLFIYIFFFGDFIFYLFILFFFYYYFQSY